MTNTEHNIKTIGCNVKLLRHHQKRNTKEVAYEAGISTVKLSQMENGKEGLSLYTITAVANALGVTTHELLEGCK